ncbi:CHAT domain-containing protein [Nonomuraea sp. SBT364]|uniref:CHAT domain-containing protein n=1 Tax=Nonomuraea sp. SBT364 TaxID=1580530 RepID=UPI00066E59C3|nr:CHAT domain-containing protein [Nonomuraea sp. SBT364]
MDDLAGSADRRMALAREWDGLVRRVRRLDGFTDFLRPPALERLLPAAAGGPVVTVNVSQWRCDALIVRPGGVTVRALPGLTAQDAADHANHYLGTLHEAERAADEHEAARRRVRASGSMADRQAAHRAALALRDARTATEEMLAGLLGWLWDVVARPVLDELGHHAAPGPGEPWPRLWWCPTGPLTLLPLHAAGHHEIPGEAVLDRVVSSYTPALRALLEARKPLDPATAGAERLLVVALADAPGQRFLPGVAGESGLLAELFPDGRRTVLEGGGATREAVRRELSAHRWAHFSCHGDQNLTDPSRGGLVLHDEMLTIADIGAGHHHAEFAGLSACKTATGGVDLLDEAVTLAAALHYTGYRHVIGTLWSVHDTAGTGEVFGAVYRDLASGGRLRADGSALALHRATRALRERHPALPSLWTPFTHTGP